jgi:glucose/arabinose dehydrogenase
MNRNLLLLVFLGLAMASNNAYTKDNIAELAEKLALLQLPPGFRVQILAADVENARQLALGDQGTIFAGSRKAGKIHAIVDADMDGIADQVWLIAEGLQMPSGLEFRDGALYVGALDRILRYDAIESQLKNPPEPVVITDSLPDKTHHGWKYLRFGPDGMLYVPVGAPCNICDEPGFAQIRRMHADGSGEEVFASGIRNSVGMAFHPQTGELWFTDNGADLMGDDIPADELNHAPHAGMHFGYPYCHQGDLLDAEFGEDKSCSDYQAPAARLGAHVAALGLSFYTGEMFPADYQGQLFIARHGSWNRSEKVGYDIALVRFGPDGTVSSVDSFAKGWLQGQEEWGRPADVMQLPDGSLLVADDKADAIYRISYSAD